MVFYCHFWWFLFWSKMQCGIVLKNPPDGSRKKDQLRSTRTKTKPGVITPELINLGTLGLTWQVLGKSQPFFLKKKFWYSFKELKFLFYSTTWFPNFEESHFSLYVGYLSPLNAKLVNTLSKISLGQAYTIFWSAINPTFIWAVT